MMTTTVPPRSLFLIFISCLLTSSCQAFVPLPCTKTGPFSLSQTGPKQTTAKKRLPTKNGHEVDEKRVGREIMNGARKRMKITIDVILRIIDSLFDDGLIDILIAGYEKKSDKDDLDAL